MIEANQRNGDWIQTFKGRKVFPLDPREDEICIEDIAHALSNICRFTGHVKHFYSVAQHSILASKYAKGLLHQKIALLHDASEAYIADVSRPLKRCFEFKQYQEAELKLQNVIFRKFGLPEGIPPEIKEIDNKLLYTEGRDLMFSTKDWHDAENVIPYEKKINTMNPIQAEQQFLAVYRTLFLESKI